MRIAVFHNFLDNIGGAEMVALTLASELKADLYTTVFDREKIKKMGFSKIAIKTIGGVPINAPLRQQAALWRFRNLNLGKSYDLYIIAGDWAISGAVNNRPNIAYVHSPVREIWDLTDYTRENIVPFFLRPLFDGWVWENRRLNRFYFQNADLLLSNSQNTKNRIKKYFNREAEVVYPPIFLERFKNRPSENFWLSVNRLLGHKRIGLQIEAFRDMPEEKLVIIGSFEKAWHFRGYAQRMKAIAPKNVEIKSWVDFQELADLYSRCKGVIATSKDEDFGLSAVEAMASGKPVIAPNEGGYKETIIDGQTGMLVDGLDSPGLCRAVKKLEETGEALRENCISRAKLFSKDVFMEKIKRQIYYAMQSGNNNPDLQQ